jgi:ABC-type lipoprotein export system ATPase subunit
MGYGITANIISAGPEETPMLGKLSFDLNPGEHAVITGASGSGKTTLLRILAGLMNYRGRVGYINAGYLKTGDDERKITTNTDNTTIIGKTSTVATDPDNIRDTEKKGTDTGLDLSSTSHRSTKSDCRDNTISPKELLQIGGISMLFQENRLLPELSAIDNLRVALPAEWQEKSLKGDLSKSDKKEKIRQIISEELKHILPGVDLSKPVSQLSGGEQRRVALARALVQTAPVVLLDEPFTGLDVTSAELVRQYISEKGNGKTLLLSEHEGEHFPEWKRIEIK